VASSGIMMLVTAILSTILAFAGWFVWGIYSGVIITPTQLTSEAAGYSYVGLGMGLTFSAAAIALWAIAINSEPD